MARKNKRLSPGKEKLRREKRKEKKQRKFEERQGK